MKVKVLGCSGGIGDGRHTTTLLIDDDVLIDAGTGLTKLPLSALASIDHVFITHAHLDHIAALPMMIDSVAQLRTRPIVVHALPETLDALRRHIFNWLIWPDFSELPTPSNPVLMFKAIEVGQTLSLPGGRSVTALPVNHQVPAVGYSVSCSSGSFAFSGDTAECPALWKTLAQISDLRALIIEAAFSDREADLAMRAGHLTPSRLGEELQSLAGDVVVLVTHLKPADADRIATELRSLPRRVALLEHDQVIRI